MKDEIFLPTFNMFVEISIKMKSILIKTIPVIIISLIAVACCHSHRTTKQTAATGVPGPKAIIYKTRADYSQLVPVTLSEDKKSVVSYPDVKDVYYQGKLAIPVLLHNGWLLDNRGINKDVAFISLTYNEYAKKDKTPDANELFSLIIDKDPLTNMYECGLRSDYQDIENDLNELIDAGKFSAFKILK
jgi:hypothetical protein